MKIMTSAVLPLPIAFSINNCHLLHELAEKREQLWSADVTACRSGGKSEVFENVIFLEANRTASIVGIDSQDGFSAQLKEEAAVKQQAFIQFLRAETKRENEVLGFTALAFEGHEYSCEGKATAAYIAQRSVPLLMGVGFFTEEGNYELLGIDPEKNGWIETARETLFFH